MNGVIETVTGDLLRMGFCDFQNDGSFKAATETVRTDVPPGAIYRNGEASFTNWNGTAWVLVAESLERYKTKKKLAIDLKTQQLIGQGFTYASKIFSLSANAQLYWSNLLNIPSGDFPLTVNTLDDLDSYNIADTTDAQGMYGAALSAVKGHLTSGTALKEQVRAATTKAEVDAVVDSR